MIEKRKKGRPLKEDPRQLGPMVRCTEREREIIEKLSEFYAMDMASALRHIAIKEYNKLVLTGDIAPIIDKKCAIE